MGSGSSVHCLTSDERWANIEKFVTDYHEYLADTGGVVLTAATRLAVARCTREALKCKGCASLPHSVCLKPGTDVYATIGELDHGKRDPSVSPQIYRLIHAVVNHQTRLDKAWYETTLKELGDSSLVFAGTNPKDSLQRETLLLSMYSELLLVIGSCLCCDIVYLVFGKELPPFPQISSVATAPSFFDWASAIKPSKVIRRDSDVAWMPYLLKGDLDIKSKSLQSLHEITRHTLLRSMDPEAPYIGLIWSPLDMEWLIRLDSTFYVDDEVVLTPFRSLSPNTHCADQFSRRDTETVGSAYSEAISCDY